MYRLCKSMLGSKLAIPDDTRNLVGIRTIQLRRVRLLNLGPQPTGGRIRSFDDYMGFAGFTAEAMPPLTQMAHTGRRDTKGGEHTSADGHGTGASV